MVQVYDSDMEEDDTCQAAQDKLNKLKAPLFNEYKFPPKAGVCLEGIVFLLVKSMLY